MTRHEALHSLLRSLRALLVGLLASGLFVGSASTQGGDRAAVHPPARHWAFVPVIRPTPPEVALRSWPRDPFDGFVLDRLETAGVTPSSEADRRTLARRVSLDLIGLPPAPSRVEQFAADARPDAYERLVDELFASPHYGEHWARPWLDLAHYADSDGYLTDQLRPVAWRYREWLVDALNRDLPFDRFTAEQIAGDLLPAATQDQRLATGFLRNTLSNREGGADLEEFRVQQVADRTETVATAWLGLTLRCARCHDHKYDPLSQREYFQLFSIFNQADEINVDAPRDGEMAAYDVAELERERRRRAVLDPIEREIIALQTEWENGLLEAVKSPGKNPQWDRSWEILGLVWGGGQGEGQLEGQRIVRRPAAQRTADERQRLLRYFLRFGQRDLPQGFDRLELRVVGKKLDAIEASGARVTRAPVVEESRAWRPTYVHLRGNFRDMGEPVRPRVPAFLPVLDVSDGERISRLHLARWLTSPGNPLVARVLVNRVWQSFFGRGLVATPADFGIRGARPSHPQLLDWLAAELVESGWRVKTLHRRIALSATYRQASRTRADLEAVDPGNLLFGRQNRLRLAAEAIRDNALSVSGLLETRLSGPSVKPPQPDSVSGEGYDTRWQVSSGSDRYRRGLYTFVQRTTPYAQFLTFDAPDPNHSCARRERSNTPLQALTLLNDEVFVEAAGALAATQPIAASETLEAAVDGAYRQVMLRSPSARERKRLVEYYRVQVGLFKREASGAPRSDGEADAATRAWIGVTSVLLNLDEFLHRE